MLDIATIHDYTRRAREASLPLSVLSAETKNAVLLELAGRLLEDSDAILIANAHDVRDAEVGGMDSSLVDRLLLTAERLQGMARDVRHVASLPDPIGEEFDQSTQPNGLKLSRRRVPLGVIGIIYESRPNVTVDISILCLKSGNAVILRGGKEALRSNAALAEMVRSSLRAHGVPPDAVQLITDPDRKLVGEMLRARGGIDLVVPRGGSALIEFVKTNAQVPVVTGGVGVCHTFVHQEADLDKALAIVHNAKTRRPSICNALDTVLVDGAIASAFLPSLAERWREAGVEMRCCPRAFAILAESGVAGPMLPAAPDDFGREFLAMRAAIKVVDGLEHAVRHIEEYGSGHSEAIVTEDDGTARAFVDRIDAAAVYVNASTQFTDGGQFGLGAELGISTQKFHARGPLGLRELTSYKWVILGNGQIRP
jgi:glutamate-5-semialdehyde dehydrogenase